MKKLIIVFATLITITTGFSTSAFAQEPWKTWGPWYFTDQVEHWGNQPTICYYQRDTVWYSPGLGINYGSDSTNITIPKGQNCPATIPE